MKRWLNSFIVMLLSLVIFTLGSSPTIAEENRIGGLTRQDTAVEISKKGWDQSNTVVLVRADQFADALTGSPLAYAENAPVLLTDSHKLTPVTKKEIQRLKAKTAIILGKESAISNSVATELKNMGLTVQRLGGKDRYETSTVIAEQLIQNYNFSSDFMFLASGENFADALASTQFASIKKYPILLSNKNSLSAPIRKFLDDEKIHAGLIYIIGGTAAISNNVEKHLLNKKDKYDWPEHSVVRIGGNDRYDTLRKLINVFPEVFSDIHSLNNGKSHSALFVNGQNFPDALTASVLASKQKKLLLMVEPNKVPYSINQVMKNFNIKDSLIIGGEQAIHPSTATQIDTLSKNMKVNKANFTTVNEDNIADLTLKIMNGQKVTIDGSPIQLGASKAANKHFLNNASHYYKYWIDDSVVYEYPFGLSVYTDKNNKYINSVTFKVNPRTSFVSAYEIIDLLEEHGFEFEREGGFLQEGWNSSKNGFKMYIRSIRGGDIEHITYSKNN